MFNFENSLLNGNRTYDEYDGILMASLLSGHSFRVFPGLDGDADSSFGLITDKMQEGTHALFSATETAIKDETRRFLQRELNIPVKEIYRPEVIVNYRLGKEREALPEYSGIIPQVIPIDWVSIAKIAKGQKVSKEERVQMPIPPFTKRAEYISIEESKELTYFDLWTVASYLSGYSVIIVPEEYSYFSLLGSSVQPEQMRSFLNTVNRIKEEQKEYLVSIGIPKDLVEETECHHGIGLEKFAYPKYEPLIQEPIPINWERIAGLAQDDIIKEVNGKEEQEDADYGISLN